MLTNDDLTKLNNTRERIVQQREYYLGTFGHYIDKRIAYILAARFPKLQRMKDLSGHLRELFQTHFIVFLADNPEVFKGRMNFPFIDMLHSIKVLKEEPEDNAILWLNDHQFVENNKPVERYSYDEAITLKINTLKSLPYGLTDQQQKSLPEECHSLSEGDVAMAMMDDYNPEKNTLNGEWLNILKRKKTKQNNRKSEFLTNIENQLLPNRLLKCLNLKEQSHLTRCSIVNGTSSSLTQMDWDYHIKLSIKSIFTALAITSRDEALDVYTLIHKVMSEDLSQLNKKDKAFKIKLVTSIINEEDRLTELQSERKTQIQLKKGEFFTTIKNGIINTLEDPSINHKAFGFAKTHVKESMKRINRMDLTIEQKQRYQNILFHEAMMLRYSLSTTKCRLLDYKHMLDSFFGHKAVTIDLLESAFLSSSIVSNEYHTEANRIQTWTAISSVSIPDELDEYNYNSKDFRGHSIVPNSAKLSEFLLKDLSRFMRTCRKIPKHQLQWAAGITKTLPEIGFHKDKIIQHKFCAMHTLMTGNMNDLKSLINDTIKPTSFYATIDQLDILLGCVIATKVPDDKTVYRKEAIISIATSYTKQTNHPHVIKKVTKNTLIMQTALLIEHNLFNLYPVLRQCFSTPITRMVDTRFRFGLPSYLAGDAIEMLTKAFERVNDREHKRHIALSLIEMFESVDDIQPIFLSTLEDKEDRIGDTIKKLEPQYETSLKNLLKLHFKQSDESPYEYMLHCPEWHQPHALALIS